MKGSGNVPGLPWRWLKKHIDDMKNPHKVTKAQVGLGNVDNTSDMDKPVSTLQKQAIDAAAGGYTNHAANRSNPHVVTAEQTGADPKGTAASQVSAHNTNASAHNDIRLLIIGLTNRLNALADSDDVDLDQLSEIVAYIKSNKTLIDSITTSKVSVKDIVNDLVTNVADKPLSAAQGVALKALADALAESLNSHTANKANPHGVDAEQVGADPKGTAASQVSAHNMNTSAHNDIRLLIIGLTNRLNALADSDDITLDQLSEIVAYIKANKTLIDSITTSKVNVKDIVNDLVTNVADKPLSAAQGVVLRALITSLDAALTKLSESFTSHNHNGERICPGFVEIGNTSAAHGGYFDFHYGIGQYPDYSTRLIEYGPGKLAFEVHGGSGYYQIFSEYHKPDGSYTGNGSETSRTINVGGLVNNASLLVITTDAGYIVFVGIWGAVAYRVTDGQYQGFYSNNLNFQDGVLKIASTSDAVNAAGSTYYYQVL